MLYLPLRRIVFIDKYMRLNKRVVYGVLQHKQVRAERKSEEHIVVGTVTLTRANNGWYSLTSSNTASNCYFIKSDGSKDVADETNKIQITTADIGAALVILGNRFVYNGISAFAFVNGAE